MTRRYTPEKHEISPDRLEELAALGDGDALCEGVSVCDACVADMQRAIRDLLSERDRLAQRWEALHTAACQAVVLMNNKDDCAPSCEEHGVMVANDDRGLSWHCAVCGIRVVYTAEPKVRGAKVDHCAYCHNTPCSCPLPNDVRRSNDTPRT